MVLKRQDCFSSKFTKNFSQAYSITWNHPPVFQAVELLLQNFIPKVAEQTRKSLNDAVSRRVVSFEKSHTSMYMTIFQE